MGESMERWGIPWQNESHPVIRHVFPDAGMNEFGRDGMETFIAAASAEGRRRG
jgi:hypothetical protein